MLKSVKYTNLRSEERSFEFGRHVSVTGENGSGKSSLKEALCFCVTGRDSVGTPAPRHLLLDPNLPLTVTIETGKGAIISRVMEPLGAQTIKLLHGKMPRSLTQKEFEAMLEASSDLILSAIVPGYFMGLSHVKQSGVLTELAPRSRRIDMVEELLGTAVDPQFKELLESDRSNMAVESEITTKRRVLDKKIAGLSAVIDRLKKEIDEAKDLDVKVSPPSQARMLELEELKNQHSRYMTARYGVEEIRSRRWQAEKRIGEIAKLREGLLDKIKAVGEFEPSINERAILEKLRTSFFAQYIPAAPQAPALFDVVDSDHCPTCGQTVGLKHKNSMREKNRVLLEKFQIDNDYWIEIIQKPHIAKLASLQKDMDAAKALIKDAESKEDLVAGWKLEIIHLDVEEEQLRKVLASPEPAFPVLPKAEFDEAEYRAEVEKFQAASKEQGAMEARKDRIEKAKSALNMAVAEHIEAGVDLFTHGTLEAALKALPAWQLVKLKDLLTLPDPWKVEVSDKDIQIFDERETPYKLLSTGERMRVDCLISLQIDALMPKRLNFLLLDNAELMSDRQWLKKEGGVQLFEFLVAKGEALKVESPLT